MSTALQSTALEEAGAVITDTSLRFARPRELTWDQYQKLCIFLGKLGQAYCWWIGDLQLIGEDLFGEEYAQIMESLPHSHHTLENYRSIAKHIPQNRRRSGISFSVHAEVAYLEPIERDMWLDKAEQNGWKREEIRAARRQAKEIESGEEAARRCPCCGKDLEEDS